MTRTTIFYGVGGATALLGINLIVLSMWFSNVIAGDTLSFGEVLAIVNMFVGGFALTGLGALMFVGAGGAK